MKISEPKKVQEINRLIRYLNFCHDGSMRKICFLKNRDVDESNGSLIYPSSNIHDCIKCDIEIDLILNSYASAKKNQIVLLEFKDVTDFKFLQNEEFDYSDIFQLKFKMTKDSKLNFIFLATNKKKKILSISCKKFICKEL